MHTVGMSATAERLRRNTRLFYTSSFLEYCYFIDAIYILFGTQYLHLDYFKAGSLFFIGLFSSLGFDFFGGVLADRFGRKTTQLIGLALQFLAFTPYLFVRSYPILAVGSFVSGIGIALTSNTLQALVYEEATEFGDARTYQRLNALSQVCIFAALAIAGLLGGVAYTINPRLPYALLMLTLLLAFMVTLRIEVSARIEKAIVTKEQRVPIMRTALRTFRVQRRLRYFVLVSFFAGLCSDLLFSYYQPYYIRLHVTALTLGCLFASIRVVSGFGSYLMHKLPDQFSLPVIQLATIVSGVVSAALLFVLKLPVVLLAPLFMALGSGFLEPTLRLFVNRHADSQARTAALSFGTTVMNFGVGVGTVTTFWLADTIQSRSILKLILVVAALTTVLSLCTLRVKDRVELVTA